MSQSVTYQRELPVKYKVDILVAGGGPAGVAAAVCVEDGAAAKDADVKRLQEILTRNHV